MDDGGQHALSYYAVLNVARDATEEEIKRAYRRQAQVFHPDKHATDDLREGAKDAFARLQAAYEVLSDPQKRDVYDIYGKEGLAAGLEVGSKLKSVEELRREWAEFKEQQERQQAEALTNHRGYYLARIDATRLTAGDLSALPRVPMIILQNSLDVPLGRAAGAHVQAQVVNKGSAGAGALITSCKRQLTPADAVEGALVLSGRPAASATATRRLGAYTTAGLTASYARDAGVALALTSSRQLGPHATALLSWTIGPAALSALSASLVRRSARVSITVKLDLGLVTSLACKLAVALDEGTSVRLSGRVFLLGAEGELGVSRRLTPIASAYVGTAVGPAGVQLKVRCSRSGQTFDFPVLLSHDYADVRLVVASAVLPPLAGLVALRFVVRPLRRWHARRMAAAEVAERAQALRDAHAKATREAALLAPVAARKAAAEAAEDGLVVLLAVYGALEEWRAAGAPAPAAPGAGEDASSSSTGTGGSATPLVDGESVRGGAAREATSPSSSTQAGGGAWACGSAAAQPATSAPQRWLDATAALQYLVAGGQLTLHPGIPKQGLMGFASVTCSAEDARLYVLYSHKRQLKEVEVGEVEALRLPAIGQPVRDAALVQQLGQQLARLKASAGGGQRGS